MNMLQGVRTTEQLPQPDPSIAFGRRSSNGQRGPEPPRREGGRYPPLSDMSTRQRRDFHEALLDADTFEDPPGKWQAAILNAEQNRPKLRVVSDA
jgi:hypothetical protein